MSALAKLEGLLPSRLRAHVGALGAGVISLTGAGQAGTDPTVLASLAIACRRGEHVALTYTDSAGRTSRRDVAAYRVVHADQRWYLVAHDVRRKAWRTFRIDRVDKAVPLGGRVAFDDPPDAAALVAEGVTTAVYDLAASVRLHLPHHVAARLVAPTVGRLIEETESTTLLRIGADDLDWLARYLVGLTCRLEVLDPPQLVIAIRDLGRRLAAMTTPLLEVGDDDGVPSGG